MDLTNASHRLGLAAAFIIIAGVSYFYFMPAQDTSKTATSVSDLQSSTASVPATAAPKTGETATTTPIATGATIKTNRGTIEVAFFNADAPKTVENFQKLAASGFYTDTKFHRVIKGFMIQGGDPLTKDDARKAEWGTGGPGYAFEDEFNKNKLVRGVLAMANSGPDTNGSQFFIVTAGATPWLDGHHTVFGKVVRGMDVVDSMEGSPTGQGDVPKTPIVVESITLK